MVILLLVFLIIGEAFSQKIPREVCSDPLDANDKIRNKFVKGHNDVRKEIVSPNGMTQDDGSTLPGSKSLFAVTYDCYLEGIALTVVAGCPSHPKLDNVPAGKAVNYALDRGAQKPANEDAYVIEVGKAIDEWKDYRFEGNLDPKTVKYENEAMAPFANMIYMKTVSIGCHTVFCDKKSRLATACVYSSKPELGQPLYNPAKIGAKCSGKQCKKIDASATCDKKVGSATEGLCTTNLKELPTDTKTTTELVTTVTESESTTTAKTESTTTTAAATESTTTAAKTTTQSSDGMTQELRDKIVDTHNYYRSMLARGLVRNGKVGNPNCPQATNMYKMRYDMTMESEAQMYANSCPAKGSEVSARPSSSGENFHIFRSLIISPDEAITNALETWWTQILKNGVNNQMKYNEYLEKKELAPIAFTQMAWAESYKVGCGFNRSCNDGTVVVCRYSPRGNIYTQFIYRTGNTCASCSATCQDALCPAPAY